MAFGGAQRRYGIRPDLTTLGKVIGGGLPVGAYGGRKDIMSRVAHPGRCTKAGTLSGNPLAVSAGLATLRHLKAHPEIYASLEARAAALCAAVHARNLLLPALRKRHHLQPQPVDLLAWPQRQRNHESPCQARPRDRR